MKKTISLCMIVKDEEENLENCLKSVNDFVDEIIIVDTGSQDSTISIAHKFTKNVFSFKWNENFSEARNFSIEKAKSDFILILDADEVITNPYLLTELSEKIDIYDVSIKNLQSNGINYSHRSNRIFKNKKTFRFENRLHEQLNIKNQEKIIIKSTNISIDHYGYKSDIEEKKEKRTRNFNIIKLEVEETPNYYTYYNLGREYFLRKDYSIALKNFKVSLKLNNGKSHSPDLIIKIAYCLFYLNYFDEAIKFLLDGIEIYPFESEIYFTLGLFYSNKKQYKISKKYFEKCMQIGDKGYQITEGLSSYITLVELSKIETDLKNYQKAVFYLKKAIEKNKEYIPSLVQLINISNIKYKEVEHRIKFIESHYSIDKYEDLQKIIEVLYNTRNVLLGSFLKKYDIVVQPNVNGVAKLLEKKYISSFLYFKNVDLIEKDNYKDVICLYFLIKNSKGFSELKFKNIKSDERIILNIIERKKINLEKKDLFLEKTIQEVYEILLKMNNNISGKIIKKYIKEFERFYFKENKENKTL